MYQPIAEETLASFACLFYLVSSERGGVLPQGAQHRAKKRVQ